MNYLRNMRIKDIINRLRYRGMYVIIDPTDDSVTLSKRLYKRMDKECRGKLDTVYVFTAEGEYAFCCNPIEHGWLDKDCKAPLPHIQYNAKYKCIGFYSGCPSVNRIVYDYGLPLSKVKVTVCPTEANGIRYYRLVKR